MGIETWLNFISMGLIVIWTIRLAGSKQQNPWVWGLASLVLITIPYLFNQPFMGLLGMLPMLFLLVRKKPSDVVDNKPMDDMTRINCSKCDVSHLNSYKYCVNCGWALDQIYDVFRDENSQYGTDNPLPSANKAGPDVIPVNQLNPRLDSVVTPGVPDLQESNADFTPRDRSLSSFRLTGLSAESLTTKGTNLFTEGRFQEAADQFTKAIALDPKYYLAWSKRAEAYLRMGMTQKAEEDLRNLEGT